MEQKWNKILVEPSTDYKVLCSLDAKKVSERFPIVIVTEASGMRGVDYRAPHSGIMLVVTRPFENYREEQQALNRVGRNGDKCTRIKAFEGDIVDALASQESFARLIAFRNEHVVRKSSLQMAKP